jgi:hypothetical protein
MLDEKMYLANELRHLANRQSHGSGTWQDALRQSGGEDDRGQVNYERNMLAEISEALLSQLGRIRRVIPASQSSRKEARSSNTSLHPRLSPDR